MAKIHDPQVWENIKDALKCIGIGEDEQTQIAKLIGVRQPSVHEWKEHTSMPSVANLRKLALKTNVCVEWLYTRRGPKHPGPPMEPIAEQLWSAWGLLSDEEKAAVAGYAAVTAAANKRNMPAKRKAV